jgi:L-2-amino-thiazoline-4-carboxylic acid hydrolase
MDKQFTEEKHSLEPITMYEITAKLCNHLSRSIAEQFGEQGQTALTEGVQNFTVEQRSEMRERTGKIRYELKPSELFSYQKLLDAKEIERTFLKYSEAQEKEGLEPLTMFAIMAKVFAHISKSVVERFGEEGREVVMKGVGTFGEERGRDIARRAAAAGNPNSMEHYLTSYDMGRSELFEYETLYHPKEIEQTFTKCAFGEQWKKDGMEEYGILYCHMIDPSIAKGFNPKFEVVHDQYVLREGVCHFRFQMKD